MAIRHRHEIRRIVSVLQQPDIIARRQAFLTLAAMDDPVVSDNNPHR
jgi:hypothetical protein